MVHVIEDVLIINLDFHDFVYSFSLTFVNVIDSVCEFD